MEFIEYDVKGEAADRIFLHELSEARLPFCDDGVRQNSHFGSTIYSRFNGCTLQRRLDHWSASGNGVTVDQTRHLLSLAPAGTIFLDGEDHIRAESQWGEIDDDGERRVFFFQIFDSDALRIFRSWLQTVAEKKGEVPTT